MALFRKFFYRKPPDGLLEISERVYVFDCCFTTDVLEEDEYKVYIGGIASQLREQFPEASFMVFNFRDGENQSLISNILSEYDMTVMDYPRHYEGCPLLTMEAIHHFLRSSESWLSLGQQNVLLMHCERGGWLVLAFMLAALLIYRKQYTGEHKTLDIIYKQAPRELLQLMSPLNPMPSQLRYLQYITRRNVGSEWPPLDRALTLDCIIIRFIPNMDGEGGCRPIFRIYGQDPFMAADRTPKVLFSTPKRSKLVRHYKQADCELVKIDIHCHIQGDVVLECISLDNDLEREEMMFRIMFNTAFIRSNILMLNREDIDILWNVKDQFPKDFRAEVLFSEMDAATSLISIDLPGMEEKDGLPVEAFAKVQEIFSNVDWLDPKADVTLNVLQQIASSGALQKLDSASVHNTETGSLLPESTSANLKSEVKASENNIKGPTSVAQGKHDTASAYTAETGNLLLESLPAKLISEPKAAENSIKSPQYRPHGKQSMSSFEPSLNANLIRKKIEPQELQVALLRPAQSKIISQRAPQASRSAPVSYCNSLQGSPVPISRYHSAPSALGITALLQDHAASNSVEEITHPVTMSPPSHASSAPDLTVPKSVQPGKLSIPAPPPLSASPSSLQSSGHATVEKISAATTPSSLPPALPQQTSNSMRSLLTQHTETTLQGRGQSAFVPPSPPPPPPPNLSVTSSPSDIEGSVLVTPHPQCTSFSEGSPSSLVKNSVSIPPPPPPPFSGSPPLPSFLEASSSSSLKNSISAPLAPPPPTSFPEASSSLRRKLPDGSLMEITKVYPLDAVYDDPEDVPEDVKSNKRYLGSSNWTVKEVVESVKQDFGSIDILVHSLANGPEVTKPLLETSRYGYLAAISASSYSYVSLLKHFAPIINPGGASISLTYIASERIIPGYGGGMSSAKAALESDTRVLAFEAGRKHNIRVNTISAGPLRSRAAKAIGFIDMMIDYSSENAPLQKELSAEEVGNAAAFLSSPLASAITGTVLYVDNGLNAMGVGVDSPVFENLDIPKAAK